MTTKQNIIIAPLYSNSKDHVVEATVTKDASAITGWINTVRLEYGYQTVVGLGCQWKPNKIGIKSTETNKVATLQLCIETKCLIVQMFQLGNTNIPQSLKEFLSDDDYTFVGVGVELLDGYGLSVNCKADLVDLDKEKKQYLSRDTTMTGMSSARTGKRTFAYDYQTAPSYIQE